MDEAIEAVRALESAAIKTCYNGREVDHNELEAYTCLAELACAALETKAVDVERLVDDLEDVIADTHDIDVTDRDYAKNVVDYLTSQGHLSTPVKPIKGLESAVDIVEQHNVWRRGSSNRPLANPKQLGVAIDIVVEASRAYHALSQGQTGWMPIDQDNCPQFY